MASAPVTLSGRNLVTVFVVLRSSDDRLAYADALGEIDTWCTDNGYRRTENWPTVKLIEGQAVLQAICTC